MATAGVRIGVVGATGAVGTALLDALAASSIRVAQLVPIASERSLGADVEFLDGVHPVVAELPSLRGFDLLFLCAPPDVSREVARLALHAEAPTIDLSGAFAAAAEVPLQIAELGVTPEALQAPLVATPAGPALACALVLRPLAEHAGLVRVRGVLLDSAAVAGRRGSESLAHESLALFNQQEPPEATVFGRSTAFDCGPSGDTAREQQAVGDLTRLLGDEVGFSVTGLQVPTFLGLGWLLHIETREPLTPEAARAVLAKAPGVELWTEAGAGPSLRAAIGRDAVLVGQLHGDPSVPNGLRLWIASDAVCLAAGNAVKLAEARLAGR
jgi:aspartate-semialdehyde dehydrogenase